MGQTSTHIQSLSSSITNFVDDCGTHSQAIINDDLINLSYDEFTQKLVELNALSRRCFASEGLQLIFAVRKGTYNPVLWKATIQIACIKFSLEHNKMLSCRLMSFREFLKAYRTIQEQTNIVEKQQSFENPPDSSNANVLEPSCSEVGAATTEAPESLTLSSIITTISENDASIESSTECCICLERKMEVLLPCTHSYCKQCIEEWCEDHHTCPICREKLNSSDDTWVLSEVPKAEEISEEIRSILMDLAEERSDHCIQS